MLPKLYNFKDRIFRELSFGKVLSTLELSSKLGKSLPFTMKLLSEMVDEGLIVESGYAASTGGRRAQTFAIAPQEIYIISVAMDQLITKIALVNPQNGEITHLRETELVLFENSDSLNSLCNLIQHFIDQLEIPKDKIVAIGIGMPGFINVEKGINYSFLKTGGESLNQVIEQKFGLPTFLDNDSSLVALAELRLGNNRSRKNAMVINFGWGVGLGLILDGKLYRGNEGMAGEFSHIPLFNNNILCSCGKTGCLETEASLMVILNGVKKALSEGRATSIKKLPDDIEGAFDTMVKAGEERDELIVELVSQTAYNIGRGISFLIHLLNPATVIISGRGARFGNILLPSIQQAVNKYCILRLGASTEIMLSPLKDNQELLGAAELVVENLNFTEQLRKSQRA